MRNLKRALSLTLASVMLLGMMVVGTSAAGFPDVDDADNVEAIEVLQAVGIMVGDKDTGNFRPDAPVSRAEMAVVMAILQNLTTSYYVSTCPFTDVSGSYDWARGPVGACYATGVISGRSATSFDPAATVTAVEAAAMMMRALGYFKYTEDYADGFQLSIVRQANQIGLFSGIEGDATSPLTRNQVAKLTLNALQANLVDFTGTPGIDVNGVKIGYKPEYTFRSGTDSKYSAISDLGNTTDGTTNQSYIQLGEQRYDGDLRLRDDRDDFGRPARTWDLNGDKIGTYAKKELLCKTYDNTLKGGDAYSDMGDAASRYTLFYAVDGVDLNSTDTRTEGAKLVRRNDDNLNSTGRGVQTEIYVDNADRETYIVVINTWLAKASTDYREKSEDIRVEVYDRTNSATPPAAPTTGSSTYTVDVEDIPEIKNLKEDDMFLVRMAAGEIVSIHDVETVNDVAISVYNSDRVNADDYGTYQLKDLTADGTKYNANVKTFWEAEFIYDHATENLYKATYNLYLDFFGNVIGVEQVEAETNYVFVVGYQRDSSHLAKAIDQALVIFPDGQMDTIQVRDDDLDPVDDADGITQLNATGASTNDGNDEVNRWFTYTVNDSNIYNLESYVARQIVTTPNNSTLGNPGVLDKNNSTIKDNTTATKIAVGNKDSVFITVDAGDEVDSDGTIVDVNGTVTGIQDANIRIKNYASLANYDAKTDDKVWAVYNDRNYILYAVVVGDSSNNDGYVYLTSGTKNHGVDPDGSYWWTFEGINKDGFTTFKSYESKDNRGGSNWLAAHNLYEMKYNKDGAVVKDGVTYKANPNPTGLNTVGYKADSYAAATIATVQTLYANGLTFQYDINNNNQFIHMTPECKFFVYASNDDEYVEYSTASSALNALGTDHRFTGTVTALVDSNGFAEVLILRDTFTENDNGSTSGGTVSGGEEGIVSITQTSSTAGTIVINNRVAADGSDTVQKPIADLLQDAVAELRRLGYTVTQAPIANGSGEYVINAVFAGTNTGIAFTTSTTRLKLVEITDNNPYNDFVPGTPTQFWVDADHANSVKVRMQRSIAGNYIVGTTYSTVALTATNPNTSLSGGDSAEAITTQQLEVTIKINRLYDAGSAHTIAIGAIS